MTEQKDVLILGNGFDLFHGLPTRYTDFYWIMKSSDDFLEMIRDAKQGNICKELVDAYGDSYTRVNIKEVERMTSKIKENLWVKYFAALDFNVETWAGFEAELKPILNLFISCIDSGMLVDAKNNKWGIKVDQRYYIELCIWDEFWRKESFTDCLIVRCKYVSGNKGIDKKKIIDKLITEWSDFIECFQIYLKEVALNKSIKTKSIFELIYPDTIISFNYSHTEDYYYKDTADIYHIHGSITDLNTMVLGVDELDHDIKGRNFVAFTKFYQRIIRHSNPGYREILDQNQDFSVTIIGHSLDETDQDILRDFIERAERVVIYYYDTADYESKITNLIRLFDRNYVEERIYNNIIQLCLLDN